MSLHQTERLFCANMHCLHKDILSHCFSRSLVMIVVFSSLLYTFKFLERVRIGIFYSLALVC